jgi:hypothetical protein
MNPSEASASARPFPPPDGPSDAAAPPADTGFLLLGQQHPLLDLLPVAVYACEAPSGIG